MNVFIERTRHPPPDISIGDLVAACANKLQAGSAQRSGGGGAFGEAA
jgi:hypothetical protein